MTSNRIWTSSENSLQPIRVANKRKRHEVNDDGVGQLSQSLSQLSLSQRKAKKQATAKVIDVDLAKNKSEQSVSSHNVLRFKPTYLKVHDKIFVRMLANAITDGGGIVQYLDIKEKVNFIRQIIEVTNYLRYFDLQRQLWQYHYDLGLKEGCWGSQLFEILC